MKTKAFLHALVLVTLLLVSWFLMVSKLREPKSGHGDSAPESFPYGNSAPAVDPAGEDASLPQVAAEPPPAAAQDSAQAAEVPQGWREWMSYLDAATSPDDMRLRLEQLRGQLFDIAPGDATQQLRDFIDSGADMRTGLAFQLRADKTLRGAFSLRAILLDWLNQLDPAAAATIARRELEQSSTQLVPDVFAIHLRNVLNGTYPLPEIQPLLERSLDGLLAESGWLDQPSSAVAEVLDLAVYLDATGRAPQFSDWLLREPRHPLQPAVALVLERLIDQSPLATIPALLEVPIDPDSSARLQRARLIARIPAADPQRRAAIDRYVSSTTVSEAELRAFLQYFPNLDQVVSYNLFSENRMVTAEYPLHELLQFALAQSVEWESHPRLQSLASELRELQERLRGPVP